MNQSQRKKILPTLARSSPLIFLIILITNVFIYPSYESIYLLVSYIGVVFSNWVAKNAIAKPLYNLLNISDIPIIGLGNRPPGASSCGITLDNKPASSFGMPSGHSQIAWTIATYLIAKYIISNYYDNNNKNNNNIIWKTFNLLFILICAVYISYSRVYIEGCHTLQQVIIGGIIGIIGGLIIYKLEDKLKHKLKPIVISYLNKN